MNNIIDKNRDFGLLLGRIAVGCLMISHGLPKLMKLFAGGVIQFPDPFGVGATTSLALTVFAEVGCSVFVILGLKTRLALIPLIVTMLVAVFIIHAADPFAKKELAVMYLLVYGILFFMGSGRYSVDQRR